MKKAQPLARRARRRRHRSLAHDEYGRHNYSARRRSAAASREDCSMTPRGTRIIIGTTTGALIGLVAVAGGFFAVTAKDRQLQQQAGAPAPKPGLATGIAGVAAGVLGAISGRLIATRKPTCSI